MTPLVFTLIATHITIAAVTMFLHRSQAHKSVTFHPIVNHFFRAWLWLTTGMVTKEWVAIHRKHHAKCETSEDPHSPVYLGVWNVLFLGVLFYKQEANNQETMEQFGKETPDDWIEKNIYSKHSVLGIMIMLFADVYMFGITGGLVWLIQMAWIPFWAAGFINGVAHWFGYRTFASKDTSTNISPLILPLGIIIGGEEFHNNHHAYPRSARLSYKPWEFDIGWFYIKTLEKFGLAQIHEFSPYPERRSMVFEFKNNISLFINKMRSIRKYEQTVMTKIFNKRFHLFASKLDNISYTSALRILNTHSDAMSKSEGENFAKIIKSDEIMAKLHSLKQDLEGVWQGVGLSVQERIEKVKEWCKQVEGLGIEEINKFSLYLKHKMGIRA